MLLETVSLLVSCLVWLIGILIVIASMHGDPPQKSNTVVSL